jgi:mannosyltransferase
VLLTGVWLAVTDVVGPAKAAAAPAGTTIDGKAQPASSRYRLLMLVVPPLVTLGVGLWGIGDSSYWRDEAATMVAVHRPFGQLIRLLGHTDVEHGVYYITLWPIVHLFGTGEAVTRFPSAVAMAVAAGFVTAIGMRLVSPAVGFAAGLVMAAMPSTSVYAQNARPDAPSVAFATAATYLLVRVLQADGRSRRRWLVGYAACMAVLGWVNVLAVFLAAAHAVTVALAVLREKDRTAARRLAVGWLAAIVAAFVITGPVIALSYAQRWAVAWIGPPTLHMFTFLPTLLSPLPNQRSYDAPFAVLIVACIALGLVVSAVGGRARLAERWPAALLRITVPWLFAPGVALIIVSFIKPLYYTRYILFCVPALALLVGAGIVALGVVVGPTAMVVLALSGLAAQEAARQPAGHGENIRGADKIVATYARPGDAVIFYNPSEESLVDAYPYGFVQLNNISQAKSPAQSESLTGTFAPPSVIRQRAAGVQRVWLVDFKHPVSLYHDISGLGFVRIHQWHIGDIWMYLYARSGPAASSGGG